MSDASSVERESDRDANSDRDDLLALLDDALDEAHRKVESGRVYDVENEKVRQGWIRALGYLAGQKRQLLRDKELDELDERLTRIEENQGIDADGNPIDGSGEK